MRKVRTIGIPVVLLGLGAVHAAARTIIDTQRVFQFAHINCIAEDRACRFSTEEFGWWRISTGRFGSPPVDLEDVSLTLDAGGQTLTWTWDRIGGQEMVETDRFPIALFSNLTALRFQTTLAETVIFVPPYTRFIADSPTVSVTVTEFPRSLFISAPGTFVTETPEPAAFAPAGMGLIGIGLRLRYRRGVALKRRA